LLDGGDEGAGEGFERECICADELDQFAELGGLLRADLFGAIHQRLEFGIIVAWFAGHLAVLPKDGGIVTPA
jgi:hypothetical protein